MTGRLVYWSGWAREAAVTNEPTAPYKHRRNASLAHVTVSMNLAGLGGGGGFLPVAPSLPGTKIPNLCVLWTPLAVWGSLWTLSQNTVFKCEKDNMWDHKGKLTLLK